MNLVKNNGITMSYFSYVKRDTVFPITIEDIHFYNRKIDLTFCIEGSLHYIYKGENITLHPGDGIFLSPGTHRERFETPSPGALYASINLTFDYDEEFEIDGYLPNVLNSDILFMLDLLKKEYHLISDKCNEKCLAIFEYIYKSICETVCNEENPHINTIKQYIFDHITEEITLGKIADHVHLAPQYVCALFKKHTGKTIMQFILSLRIDMAKTAIVTTSDPISQIAEDCGFDDYCYFSHVFKKMTGISARQYRNTKKK